ncbi:MAG: hypothetical protein ACKO0Z_03855 [Betaproteobacteria bacterium]
MGIFDSTKLQVAPDKEPYQFTQLYSTTVSIGSGNFFRPQIDARGVVCMIAATVPAGSSASVSLLPRDIDGANCPAKFREAGGEEVSAVSVTSSGTRYFFLDRQHGVDRVHSGCIITGSGVTVTVSFANAYGGMLPAGGAATYYEDTELLVSKSVQAVSFAAFENWTARVDTAGRLTVTDGSSAGTVLITDLPGWRAGDAVQAMGFIPYKQGGPVAGYSRETAMRLCFFTKLGNVYHNYPATNATDSATTGGMADFDLSAIYEPMHKISDGSQISSVRIPSNDSSLSFDAKLYRYEPGLPAWNYAQHSGPIGGVRADASAYGSGGMPATIDKGDIRLARIVTPFDYGTNPQNASYPFTLGGNLCQPFSVHPKCTVFVPYNGTLASKPVILGTTDGGRTWVVMHELGGTATSGIYQHGNNYDYSAIGAYSSGELSVVRRTFNLPTNSAKEPAAWFRYEAPISITAIATTGGKAVATTAASNTLQTGDLVCFKKNAAGNYSFLENTVTVGLSADTDSTSAGNGRFYRVKRLTATTFEILQNYAGVDEKFGTHHIHSGNPAKDGVVVACGEKYPNGWICFIRIPEIDDYESFNVYSYRASQPYIYRLNSGIESMQRAVGCLLSDDADQTITFASDDGAITRPMVTIAGRTNLFSRGSGGVFSGKLSDIDDLSKATCILEMDEASLGIISAQGMYAVLGMSRYLYLSPDKKRWVRLPLVGAGAIRYVGESPGCMYFLSTAASCVYKVRRK